MSTAGFKIVTFKELRDMKVATIDPRPKVIFVERRESLRPPKDKIEKYEELLRRMKDSRGTDAEKQQRAADASHYDRLYRHKLLNSGESLKTLRELAGISRERLVVLVQNNDRPDSQIIKNICEFMKAGGTW